VFRAVRRHLTASRADSEAGISIIEVLVASIVFMILAVAIAHSLVAAIRLAADQRHRVTAIGLAASELDLVRSAGDPFLISARAVSKTVDGLDYKIERSVSWVDSNGVDVSCTTTSAVQLLKVKRVNIRVTWSGQLAATSPVSTDSIISPSAGSAETTLGAIAVSVKDTSGLPVAGLTASVKQGSGSSIAKTTDGEGCAYFPSLALTASPVTAATLYTVSLTGGGYVDITNSPAPSVGELSVEAAKTTAVSFSVEKAAKLRITDLPDGLPSNAILPAGAKDTLTNSKGTLQVPVGGTVSLFPYVEGYTVVPGGDYVGGTSSTSCQSPNPALWPETSGLNGGLAASTGALTPGADLGTVDAPWGYVTVRLDASLTSTRYIVAYRDSPAGADPGCNAVRVASWGNTSTPPSCTPSNAAAACYYFFPSVGVRNNGDEVTIALPYGTWRLGYVSKNSSNIPTSGFATSGAKLKLTAWSNQESSAPSITAYSFTVTLDPRTKK